MNVNIDAACSGRVDYTNSYSLGLQMVISVLSNTTVFNAVDSSYLTLAPKYDCLHFPSKQSTAWL